MLSFIKTEEQQTKQLKFLKNQEKIVLSTKAMPSLILILMGSLDCLTTVIGTMYLGAHELNPLIAGLVNTDIAAFVVLKLTATIGVGALFIIAQKTLMKTADKKKQIIHNCTQNHKDCLL
jgi:hypothetical protein